MIDPQKKGMRYLFVVIAAFAPFWILLMYVYFQG